MSSNVKHWEHVYKTKKFDSVSWYKPHLDLSLSIIKELQPNRNKSIMDIGGGQSTLLNDLILEGYTNLNLIDISATAVNFQKKRFKANQEKITWHIGDITKYSFFDQKFDFWHDRAVFHFLTNSTNRKKYKNLLLKSVKKGGHVLISTFGSDGPSKCSGLPVERYNSEKLSKELGKEFKLLGSKLEEHCTPFDTTQQFLYCWFKSI